MSYVLPIMILIGIGVNIVVSARNAKTLSARRFMVAAQLACVLLAMILVVVPAILTTHDRLPMRVYLVTASLFFLILVPFEWWTRRVFRRKSAL